MNVITKILMYFVAPIVVIIATVVVNMAIFDSAERLGDELHDYFEGHEEGDD
jgi:hypothetical protein